MNESQELQTVLKQLAKAEAKLYELGVIRSSKIVAELGEYYAMKEYGLQLAKNKIQKGYDLIDDLKVRYQVKCRRVYDNPSRSTKSKHLIKGLEKDGYDMAIIIEIGHDYDLIKIFSVSRKRIIEKFGKKMSNITVPKLEAIADKPIYQKNQFLFGDPVPFL